jgi:predicted Zn-ribbon and HTH transcriptional regulator
VPGLQKSGRDGGRAVTKKKTQEELDDEASDLLCSAVADKFARALNRQGWMIVLQPEVAAAQTCGLRKFVRWPMDGPGECPVWAEPWEPIVPARSSPPAKTAKIIPFRKPEPPPLK